MTNGVTGNQPGGTLPGGGGTTTAPQNNVTNAQNQATNAQNGQGTTPQAGNQANNNGQTGGTTANSNADDQRLDNAFKVQYNVAVPALPGQTTLTGGINILSKMYSIRSNRLADISLALANYTNATGQLNQAAVVKLQQENDANSNLNQLIKSLFDKQADAIRAWVQLR
jgi:hypothetical protein